MAPRALILGGGVAGLCAALTHREHGYEVCLVERTTRLGGRAWSGTRTGETHELDNGPHVLLGCYRSFRRLLQTLGTEDLFWRPPELRLSWLEPGGRMLRLRPPPLPAPFHLVAGLLGIEGLGLGARTALLWSGIQPFLPLPPASLDLATWMKRRRVGATARRLLFEPLCRAVLNLDCDRAEARLFLRTLREAFLGGRAHSALWVPRRPWGAILDEPARRVLPEHGIEVELGRAVTAIEPAGRRSPLVRFADGGVLDGHDRVVLALPWAATARLCAGTRLGEAAAVQDGAAILTVHLELPAEALPFDDPVIALVDGDPFHFLVRRSDERGRALTGEPCALLAADAAADGRTAEQWIDLALDHCARWLGRDTPWPPAVRATARLRREADATFRPQCGRADRRPRPGPTTIPGLLVCGDWTDTGLPSTLEGAARSGYVLCDDAS